ncbi:MAG: 2-C-methyl-D-erythritol 4-phosphate cytidylyltransferase [Gammaproteobacteria bacterium]
MDERAHYWAVIPAAGVGARMDSNIPKQYFCINGKPILEYTLERFCNHSKIDGVVAVIADNDSYWSSLSISGHKKIQIAPGGQERCHSVLNGLRFLSSFAQADDWVLVHDAARPCLRSEDIDHLIEELSSHPVGGVLAVPVRDTMKRAGNNNEIIETVERSRLWHALTPQMFRLAALTQAIEQQLERGHNVTDEAMAIELSGAMPVLVQGHADNIKVTQMGDVLLAEMYLK